MTKDHVVLLEHHEEEVRPVDSEDVAAQVE